MSTMSQENSLVKGLTLSENSLNVLTLSEEDADVLHYPKMTTINTETFEECPVCYESFSDEELMYCSNQHIHACAYCVSKIQTDNCSICRNQIFETDQEEYDEYEEYEEDLAFFNTD